MEKKFVKIIENGVLVENRNYIVYENGDVYSVRGNRILKPQAIAGYKNKKKYLAVSLNKKLHYVHRVVFFTFVNELPKNDYQVNHKDGNKRNNNLTNLEYITKKQNMEHAQKAGLLKDQIRTRRIRLTQYERYTWDGVLIATGSRKEFGLKDINNFYVNRKKYNIVDDKLLKLGEGVVAEGLKTIQRYIRVNNLDIDPYKSYSLKNFFRDYYVKLKRIK